MDDLCSTWLSPLESFPSHIEELKAYLATPLRDEEKIPIIQRYMDKLVTHGYAHIECNESDAEKLFRISNEEDVYTSHNFFTAVQDAPPPSDGSESSFIYFWDNNIRRLFEAIFPEGKAVRDTNHGTSTRLCRPDFGFLIDGVCVFRGEEKQPGFTGTHPRDELIQKLDWTYNPAPYVIGHHISLI